MMRWRMSSVMALMSMVALDAASAQRMDDGQARWVHGVSVGAWGSPAERGRENEPSLGAMLTLDAQRYRPGHRAAFATALGVYTKGRGDAFTSRPGATSTYSQRQDLVFLTLGSDFALTTGRTRWTVGVGAGPAVTQIASRLIDQTPNNLRSSGLLQEGWRFTGILLARSNVTMAATSRMDLRVGVDAVSGVQSALGKVSSLAGSAGIVLRR